MDPIEGIIVGLVGLVIGGGVAYAVLRNGIVRLETRLDEREKQLETVRQERDQERKERDEQSEELTQARADIKGYQSAAAEREKAFADYRKDLDTHFKGLASDVLTSSSDEFRKQAEGQFKARETAIKNLVDPVHTSLDKLRQFVDKSNQERITDTTKVSDSVERLVVETSGLRAILHNPQLRGAWGEQHLRNVIEAAGMTPHVDYIEQGSVTGDPDGGNLRPDVRVQIPGGATVIIDAKTPHDRYDEALRSDNERDQEQLLASHADALADHARELAGRNYTQWVPGSPDFLIMYVPTDPILDMAIKAKPAIWQDTWQRHRVLIATPGLLIAFLRTVALAWRQQDIQENAEEIAKNARALYSRLRTYAGHVVNMGTGLRQAVRAYNKAVGSFQARLLPKARDFEKLGGAGEANRLEDVAQIENTVRQPENGQTQETAQDEEV